MVIRIHGKRILQTPPGLHTRPTAAKVRESLFNIWSDRILDCRWLDLCAGSGAMGAEALSRGAQEVIGIERYGPACKIVQQNWRKIALPQQRFQILRGDVRTILKKPSLIGFDLIYFDPPYQERLYLPILQQIGGTEILKVGGAIAAEHSRDLVLPQNFGCLSRVKVRTYGKTALTFYERISALNI